MAALDNRSMAYDGCMVRRTTATGGFNVPPDWPTWSKRCGANRKGREPCASWAVRGMPTCRRHGSGGQRNRDLGHRRYLCWVILGGPQNMPLRDAVSLSLSVFMHLVIERKGNEDQQLRAALWLTSLMNDTQD